jgi:hypothetical protein
MAQKAMFPDGEILTFDRAEDSYARPERRILDEEQQIADEKWCRIKQMIDLTPFSSTRTENSQ